MHNNRINWIDIARGILIIQVVVGHMAYFGSVYTQTNLYNFVGAFNFTLLPYYMPAFFIITGFVSNFDSPFPLFFKKNILYLIIPNIIIGIFLKYWMKLFLNEGLCYSNFLYLNYKHLLVTGGNWFLPALFFSKLIYWAFEKYFKKDNLVDIIIFLMLFFTGILLYRFQVLNVWFYQHALILTPFLFIGKQLKKHQKFLNHHIVILVVGGVFLIVMFICQINGIRYPYINAQPSLPLKSCLLVFPLSIIGTLTIFSISQLLNNCQWLSITGRHSLTIYLLHSNIAVFLINHSLLLIDSGTGFIIRFVIVASIIIITITLCVIIDKLIDKHFPCIKGRFR